MIKVDVKNLQDEITHFGTFADEAAADAWIALNSQKTVWGAPGSYTTTKTDISVEVEINNKRMLRQLKRSFGEYMIDKIASLNDSKNLTIEQVDSFMDNAVISKLREHLWAGNIDTFVAKLEDADVSAFFSSGEKTAVINECETFLSSL